MAAWVKNQFDIVYTASSTIPLLHRLDFVYKKPKLIPGKADPATQEAFLGDYEKIK